MRAVLFGALTYAFAIVGSGVALSTISVLQHGAGNPRSNEYALMASFLAFLPGALSTLGFVLVTACSSSWRRQALPFVLFVSASLGVVAFLLQVTGLASLPVSMLLPSALLRAWPRASAFVVFAGPGVLAGVMAVLAAQARGAQPAAAKRVVGADSLRSPLNSRLLGRTMSRTAAHDVALVLLAVVLQLALWVAFRWVGLQVHGEVPGAPIPEWFGFLSLPLTRVISIAPAFLVGWFATRHGAALGAVAAVLASVAGWGFNSLPGAWSGWSLSSLQSAPVSSQVSSALAAAILGGVAGAAGVFFSQRMRPNPSLNADVPHAGAAPGSGPPVS